MKKIKIGGIIEHAHLARVSLAVSKDASDLFADLLEAFSQEKLNVELIVQSAYQDEGKHYVFCVHQEDQQACLRLVYQQQQDGRLRAVECDPQVASLSVYGPDFRIRPGLAGAFLKTLHAAGIPVQAISTSISTFTVVIPAAQRERALAALEQVVEMP